MASELLLLCPTYSSECEQLPFTAIAIVSLEGLALPSPLGAARSGCSSCLAYISPKWHRLLHELKSQVWANPEASRLLRALFPAMEFRSPFITYVPSQGSLIFPHPLPPSNLGPLIYEGIRGNEMGSLRQMSEHDPAVRRQESQAGVQMG